MDSVDSVRLMNIRCAVAGCEIWAGDRVYLQIKDGMLVADKVSKGVAGVAIFDGRCGEDIAVKNVAEDIAQLTGKITVFRVPGIIEGGSRAADVEKIRGFLENKQNQKIGAMGTSAKVLLKKIGLKYDFEFDVIQSSMLAALRGLNITVFASGGMADRVLEKVKERHIDCQCFKL